MQPVMHLVPQPDIPQYLFDNGYRVCTPLNTMLVQRKFDITVDRERKWRRLLEYHADLPPQCLYIAGRVMDVTTIDANAAGNSTAGNQVGKPIDGG